MEQLRQREKEQGIAPDPEIDAFMRASIVSGKRHSLVTELTLRILGLEVQPFRSCQLCSLMQALAALLGALNGNLASVQYNLKHALED